MNSLTRKRSFKVPEKGLKHISHCTFLTMAMLVFGVFISLRHVYVKLKLQEARTAERKWVCEFHLKDAGVPVSRGRTAITILGYF